MKKTILTMFLSIMLIGSIGLVACGGNDTSSIQTQVTSKTSAPEQTTTAAPATTSQPLGDMWSDMPVYPGAATIQTMNFAAPPAEDEDYSKVEWRYYETGDDVSTVADYCKNKMLSNNWQEQMWISSPAISYGMYIKNNENDAAMIYIVQNEDNGKTGIAFWRAKK